MYVPDTDLAAANSRRQKREYLKGGCRECKRRKIKCNEEKPQCWQCTRLKKQCSYPYAGEKVARVSKRDGNSRLPSRSENIDDSRFGGAAAIAMAVSSTVTSPVEAQIRDAHLQTSISGVLSANPAHAHPSRLYPPAVEVPQIQTAGYENLHLAAYDTRTPAISAPSMQLVQSIYQTWPVTYQHDQINPGFAPHPLMLQPFPLNPATHPHPHGQFPQAHHGVAAAYYPSYGQLAPPTLHLHNFLPPPQNGAADYYKQYGAISAQPSRANLMPPQTSDPSPIPHSASPSASIGHVSGVEAFSDTTLRPDSTEDSSSMLDFFSQEDLNMIATDLNEIVHRMVVDTKGSQIGDETPSDPIQNSFDERRLLVAEAAPFGNPTRSREPSYPRNIAPNLIELRGEAEESYLNEYHSSFAYVILPFGCYDQKLNTFVNPVRDMTLLKASREPFLLAAVLAHGARLLYEKYHRPRDQEAYCTYLNICLQMLEPALERSREQRRAINANTEAVLITVLLLTSASAALSYTEWRLHLRGAKELLLRHLARNARSSPVLVLCKMWYVTLEYLAGISSVLGGTIDLDEELSLLLAMGDPYELLVLRKWGIVDESNFNVFVGIDHGVLMTHQEVLEYMRKVRTKEPNANEDLLCVLRYFSEMFVKSQIVYLTPSCVATKESLCTETREKFHLTDEFTLDGKTYIVSWRDVSNQAYVLGGLIYLLLLFFGEPYDAPQIQAMARKLIANVEQLSQVHYNTDNPIMYCVPIMIHWPMLIAGVLLMDNSKRFVVERYFEACQSRGLLNSRNTLARVRRVWDERDRGIFNDPLATDGSDTISY